MKVFYAANIQHFTENSKVFDTILKAETIKRQNLMVHFVRTMLFLNEVEVEKIYSGGMVKILLIILQ